MASAISRIFGSSPIPNQMMNKGVSASDGMVRLICRIGSIVASPARDRPAIRASVTPTVRPMPSPAAARISDTSRLCGSTPLTVSSQNVPATVLGAASTRGGIRPACDPASHSSSRTTGDSQRCCAMERRRFRTGDGIETGSTRFDARVATERLQIQQMSPGALRRTASRSIKICSYAAAQNKAAIMQIY